METILGLVFTFGIICLVDVINNLLEKICR